MAGDGYRGSRQLRRLSACWKISEENKKKYKRYRARKEQALVKKFDYHVASEKRNK